MIGRIKGLMESEANISRILENTKEGSKASKESRDEIKDLKKAVSLMNKDMTAFGDSMRSMLAEHAEGIKSISELRENLKAEITDFKLLKTTIKQKLVDEITTGFRAEFGGHMDRLKTDVKAYNELKSQLQNIGLCLEQTRSEFSKFNNISREIKEADFRLTGYANKVTSLDQEKLKLMKRIDDLQRLIAKERRSGR